MYIFLLGIDAIFLGILHESLIYQYVIKGKDVSERLIGYERKPIRTAQDDSDRWSERQAQRPYVI